VDETFGERVSVTVIATGFDQRLATRRREEQAVPEPREEPADQPEGDVLDIPAFLRRR
jgi:cell division protein FtsZ